MNSIKATPPAFTYTFKGKPLQRTRFNNYTQAEKIELIEQLWNEYNAGILKPQILTNIVLDNLFPAYTAQLILNDMMEKGVLKINPFNNTTKPIFKKKGIFDW